MRHHVAHISFEDDLVTREDLKTELTLLQQRLVIILGGIIVAVGGVVLTGVKMMLP